MEKQTRACQECGKNYITYYDAKDNFCSRACRKQSTIKKHMSLCEQCNQPFMKDSRPENKFCSHACYAESLKGKTPHNYDPITVTCQHCRKEFITIRSRLGKAKYCSPKCGSNAKQERINKLCINCGKAFTVIPSQSHVNCCSNKCKGKYYSGHRSQSWKGGATHCAGCNQLIHRPPYRIQRSEKLYCSKSCYSQWMSDNLTGESSATWKGGPGYYGPNWKRQSAAARSRDGYKCQVCGVHEKKLGRKLDVHHIVPLRTFGNDYTLANQLSNLICLCDSCHKKAEHGKVALQPSLI